MKDIKIGDAHYRAKGLKKVIAQIDSKTAARYEKKRQQLSVAHKHKWSKTSFYSYWLTIKAPKG